MWTELAVCACLIIGTFFVFVSAMGLLRLPDVYSRLHAVTKATTLGMAGILGASAITFAVRGDDVLPEILTVVFIFLTNPVGGHMIARSAYLIGIPMTDLTIVDQMQRAGEGSHADHDQE